MLLVLWLRSSGVVTSIWAGMAVGVAASFLASYAGARFWKTRDDSRDILFSDLMPWGWLQRWRTERRLLAATDLLGLTTRRSQAIPDGILTGDQKARLLTRLGAGLESRDPYTYGHSRRVARHASNIAKRMGLSGAEVAKIRAAGAMHDVGKVETPIAVLHKEGRLTDEEYAIIQRHPVDGAEMVSTLYDAELTAMVRHHHERLDGTGYPDQLAGDAIPIGARILAVADTFDAVTSTRPYRRANAHKKALDILVAEAGTQLDPDAVHAFCSCYSGSRPLACWTILVNGRPRVTAWLGGGVAPANAATAANAIIGVATAAAVGVAVAVVPLAGLSVDSSRALADSSVSHPPTKARSRAQDPAHQTFRSKTPGSRAAHEPADRPGRRKAHVRRTETGKGQGGSQAKNSAQAGSAGSEQLPPTAEDKGNAQEKVKVKDNGTGQGNSTGKPVKVKDKGSGSGQAPGVAQGKGKPATEKAPKTEKPPKKT